MFANNQSSLTGNLGGDPEIRFFDSGKSKASFRIAVSTGKESAPDWFDIECWNASAERAVDRLRKGSRVVVSGSLKQERWQDGQSGTQRSKVVLNAESIEIIERSPQQPQQQPEQLAAPEYADYDDIPF